MGMEVILDYAEIDGPHDNIRNVGRCTHCRFCLVGWFPAHTLVWWQPAGSDTAL